jgi:hypothetical protein
MFFAAALTASMLLNSAPLGDWPLLFQEPQQSSDQPTQASGSAASRQSMAPKPCATASSTPSAKQTDCPSVPPKKKKHHATSSPVAPGTSSTKVVRNGGTSEPVVAISPAETHQQAIEELSTTNQLLANADANLKELARRQLSADDEDIVKQIQAYIQQARAAVKNGEAQRAHILANKADMLSGDLVRPRR